MIDIGKLRDKVVIERPTDARDDSGQVFEWQEVTQAWAEIMTIRGTEKLRAMAMESTLTHRVRVRYQAVMMPPLAADAMRIRFGERLFAINAAVPDAKRSEIVFECTEGSHDGQ